MTPITEAARATVAITASPNRSSTGGTGSDTQKPTDWLPLWVGIIAAATGLVGSLGAQFIAAWKETRRLATQNLREDQLQKRNELTVLYTELLRDLDNYLVAVTK